MPVASQEAIELLFISMSGTLITGDGSPCHFFSESEPKRSGPRSSVPTQEESLARSVEPFAPGAMKATREAQHLAPHIDEMIARSGGE